MEESVPRPGDFPRQSSGESQQTTDRPPSPGPGWSALAMLAVFIVALAALIPTIGDFGLSWDEPAYRYSQVLSAQWWEQLAQVRNF